MGSRGGEKRSHGNHYWDAFCYNWLCVNDSDYRRLVMEEGLSGQPTKCRYCRYPATKRRCHGNHFLAFNIRGAHGSQLTNTSEPSVCGGDAALCQITLTTCQNYMYYHMLNSVLSVAAQLQRANFCALLCVLVIMLKKTITRFCCLLHASTRWMDWRSELRSMSWELNDRPFISCF